MGRPENFPLPFEALVPASFRNFAYFGFLIHTTFYHSTPPALIFDSFTYLGLGVAGGWLSWLASRLTP